MSYLSEKIRELQGDRTQDEMAQQCGVSRNVFSYMARGQSVKLSTLRQIAGALQLSKREWLELLIAWIRAEIGEEDFRNLTIQPHPHAYQGAVLHDAEREVDQTLVRLFNLLSQQEQTEILKALQRQEVLNCLPPINRVWEKFSPTGTETSSRRTKARKRS